MTNAEIDNAVMDVIRTLTPRREDFWRATDIYERMGPAPRRRIAWDDFIDLDEVAIRKSLDRLQEARRIERVHHHGTGRPVKTRSYEFLTAEGEAA